MTTIGAVGPKPGYHKPGYHRCLLETYFSDEYKIEHDDSSDKLPADSSSFALKPRDNPSVVTATIEPMYKTRFKFVVRFGSGEVSFGDAYRSKFNRVNGATPWQQRRIAERNSDFEERMKMVQAQMIFDADRAKRVK